MNKEEVKTVRDINQETLDMMVQSGHLINVGDYPDSYYVNLPQWFKVTKGSLRVEESMEPPVEIRKHLSKWISVNDRLPEKDGYYLVAFPEGGMNVSWFYVTPDHEGNSHKWIDENITHWQPLPDPPQK